MKCGRSQLRERCDRCTRLLTCTPVQVRVAYATRVDVYQEPLLGQSLDSVVNFAASSVRGFPFQGVLYPFEFVIRLDYENIGAQFVT